MRGESDEARLAFSAFLLTLHVLWEALEVPPLDRPDILHSACELLRQLRDSELTIRDPGFVVSIAPSPEMAETLHDSSSRSIAEDRELARMILTNLPAYWFRKRGAEEPKDNGGETP